MQPVIAYLFKLALCSAILLAYYWLVLRNERFHRWNRFYLLAALFLSIAVPFLNLPLPAAEEPTVVVNMVAELPWNKVNTATAFAWSWKYTLNTVTILVSLALLLQLLLSVIKIIRLYKSHSATQLSDVSLLLTEEQSAPFSFFKWLFWRKDIDPDSENGQRMLQHELTHIREKHSADKLFTELLLIVFWMNPVFWIMRRELYAIHEFLADQKAIAAHDGAAFAGMILQASHASTAPTLSNPFFTSQLKRRLIMITNSKTPSHSYLRRICGLVLMLTTTVLLVLSIEQAQAQKTAPPPPPPAPAEGQWTELPDSIKSAEVIDRKGVCYIRYEMKDGRKFVYELNQAKKKNYFIPPPPPPAPLLPPPPPPSPVKTKDAPDAAMVIPAAPPALGDWQTTADAAVNSKPVYVYAGLEITEAQMNAIDPNSIASVDVLKGDAAIKAYGERGKNGIVKITPKNQNLDDSKSGPVQNANVTIRQVSPTISPVNTVNSVNVNTDVNSKVLYVVNKQKVSVEAVNNLQADAIVSINVLKDADAVNQYGEDGKNGVVQITTKDAGSNNQKTGIVFTKAESMPSFVGGNDAWNKFLQQNMNYPLEARKAKAKVNVTVQFIVNADGSLSDVKALNDPGYGLVQEAERLIKASPAWKPAVQNGHKVPAFVKQEIRFQPG